MGDPPIAPTALHQATNPGPLSAAAGTLGFAGGTLHDTRPDFVDEAGNAPRGHSSGFGEHEGSAIDFASARR